MTARFQPFNDLAASQYESLKADVEARGVVNPILVDEEGVTIDGHQRRRVAADLGIDCPRIVIKGLSHDEKMSLAIALNTFRRHLTGVERTGAIHKMAQLGMSQRRIAEATGLSQATVHRDLRSTSGDSHESPERTLDPETGEISGSEPSPSGDMPAAAEAGEGQLSAGPAPTPAPNPRVTGKDGKSYPATKPKPERTEADALAARIAASDVGYRAAVSRETSKTRDGLLTLDAERAAAICQPEDRRSAFSFVEDVRSWLDTYEKALGRTNLRRVQ